MQDIFVALGSGVGFGHDAADTFVPDQRITMHPPVFSQRISEAERHIENFLLPVIRLERSPIHPVFVFGFALVPCAHGAVIIRGIADHNKASSALDEQPANLGKDSDLGCDEFLNGRFMSMLTRHFIVEFLEVWWRGNTEIGLKI